MLGDDDGSWQERDAIMAEIHSEEVVNSEPAVISRLISSHYLHHKETGKTVEKS
jgi:hypothetical protein